MFSLNLLLLNISFAFIIFAFSIQEILKKRCEKKFININTAGFLSPNFLCCGWNSEKRWGWNSIIVVVPHVCLVGVEGLWSHCLWLPLTNSFPASFQAILEPTSICAAHVWQLTAECLIHEAAGHFFSTITGFKNCKLLFSFWNSKTWKKHKKI